MSQMKERGKDPEGEISNLPKKIIQSNESKDDSRSWKKNGGKAKKMQEMPKTQITNNKKPR